MSADDFQPAAPDRATLLRKHFALAVTSVLDERCGDDATPRPTTEMVQQLTEVAWSWTVSALAPDLERFAKHAKRTRIAPDDVLLAARKSPATEVMLEREAAKLRSVKRKVGAMDTA